MATQTRFLAVNTPQISPLEVGLERDKQIQKRLVPQEDKLEMRG
jgi:hypothetical protein